MTKTNTPAAPAPLQFNPFSTGVDVARDGSHLFFRVSMDEKTGISSASGKTLLTGNSHGWAGIPGVEGWTANIGVGKRTKPA